MTSSSTTSAADAAARSGVTVRIATRDDLPAVLAVQREAFMRVARWFGIPPEIMAPMRETLEEIEDLYESGMRTFVAIGDGTVVGTVRASVRTDGVVEIGRLAVGDAWLRRGIAIALMLALEESYPDARRFELFTGSEAFEPLALYDKLGYTIVGEDPQEHFTLVWLAKER